MNIYKLLIGIAVLIFLVLGAPYLASYLGWIPRLNDNAWLVLVITAISLAFKACVADIASGEFLWHKYGYDNCVITFGGCLTALTLQLTAGDKDLFSGLNNIVGSIPVFASISRSFQLFLLLLATLIATLLTAIISRSVKTGASASWILSGLNSAIGSFFLMLYVAILVTKG